jgi:hypothetical protein
MTETQTITAVRFVADHQLMSDSEGGAWMTHALTVAKERGDIVGFDVTGSHRGAYGLQFVTFTFDVAFSERLPEGVDYPEAREIATALANEIVGDSDVEVRWASPIETPAA